MKAATEIREKEHAVFVAERKEFSTVIDMLQRAITVLEKELGSGAFMMQIKSATSLEQALTVTVKADDDSEQCAPGLMLRSCFVVGECERPRSEQPQASAAFVFVQCAPEPVMAVDVVEWLAAARRFL